MPGIKRASLVLALSAAAGWLWPSAAQAVCGCTQMTLKHSGITGILCSNANLNFLSTECAKYTPGSSKGCTTTYAYDCQLGVNSKKYSNVKPYQKTGFLSVAAMAAGSTVTDCKTGQLLQETITGNGVVETNPKINPTSISGAQTLAGKSIYVDNSSANPFPQIGATSGSSQKYGGDDYKSYTASDVLFSYNTSVTPRTLSWWDNPDQTKDSQSEAATWKFRFISFVLGSAGQSSCVCSFDIAVTWPSNNNNPTTTYTYRSTDSSNCTW
jgi:hypothetical protein